MKENSWKTINYWNYFWILGVWALFFGPIPEIIVETAILNTLSSADGADLETFILSLVGIFSPILSEISLGTKFSRISDNILDLKIKYYSNLDKFSYIKFFRGKLNKDTCS